VKIFGGGGGTILPSEIAELQGYGITRIYHPDDGRSMGLQGMINDLIEKCDFPVGEPSSLPSSSEVLTKLADKFVPTIARVISGAENFPEENSGLLKEMRSRTNQPFPYLESPVLVDLENHLWWMNWYVAS